MMSSYIVTYVCNFDNQISPSAENDYQSYRDRGTITKTIELQSTDDTLLEDILNHFYESHKSTTSKTTGLITTFKFSHVVMIYKKT